jgi:hypothetical protein
MSGLVVFMIVVVALFVLDLLAQTHGVDTREQFEDPRARVRSFSY